MSKFKPKISKAPKPAPTPDPAIEERVKKQSLAEKRRKGRRASILTSISDEEAQLANVNRPGARLSNIFGRSA